MNCNLQFVGELKTYNYNQLYRKLHTQRNSRKFAYIIANNNQFEREKSTNFN